MDLLLYNVISCEQVAWMGHMLELQVVVAGVLEEHSPLFARGTFKAEVRLDDEFHTSLAQSVCETVEILHRRENAAEMRHRDLVPVYGIEIVASTVVVTYVVTHELVPE